MRTRIAALLAVATVAGTTLAACGSDDGPSVETATEAATPPSSSAATTEPSEPTDATSPTQGATTETTTVAAPAYFVGQTPLGSRLFREFRQVEADNPVDEALALVTAGDALDPDYLTLLPAGTPPTSAGGLAVALPDASWAARPDGMTAKQAKLAVQQIVYTVQGVEQSRDPVTFTLDGAPTPVFGIDAPNGVKAGKFFTTLALCNITAPAEGDTVTGSFTASGVASSFEGTVPWEVRDGSGAVVVEGFAQAEGYVDDVYPWETSVDVSALAPGTYTFAAMTDDPSGGEGGAGPAVGTMTITVQ